jgi:hypothetical protein
MIVSVRRVGAAVAVAGLAVLAMTACSSSKSGPEASTPPSSTTGTSSGATQSGSSDAAAEAAIKDAYARFFAPNTPEATSLGLLQNGHAFKAVIEAQAKTDYAKRSSAKVSTVTLLSANTAKVAYTILVDNQAMLKDQPGYALRENGTWKVAEYTFCSLLTLEGTAPPDCKSAVATTVPK